MLADEEYVIMDAIYLYRLFGFEYFRDVVKVVLNWTCFWWDIIASLDGTKDLIGVRVVDCEVVLVGEYF